MGSPPYETKGEAFMAWFNNLKLQVKLFLGFGLVTAFMVIISIVAIMRMGSMDADASDLYNVELTGTGYIMQAEIDLVASGQSQQDAILATTPEDIAKHSASARTSLQSSKENLKKFESLIHSDAVRQQAGQLESVMAQLETGREAVLKAVADGQGEAARTQAVALRETADKAAASMSQIEDTKLSVSKAEAANARGDYTSARTMIIALALVAGAFGLGFAFWLARRIKSGVQNVAASLDDLSQNAIRNLANAMAALGAGDLGVEVVATMPRITYVSKDEIGHAAAATTTIIEEVAATVSSYNDARSNLAGLVGNVNATALGISSASEQLRDASDQMASATGQIATAINEVTRSAVSLSALSQDSAREVEQVAAGSQQLAAAAESNSNSAAESNAEATRMSERILSVAARSQEVARSAEDSRSAAVTGQEAVQQAVTSMQSIATAVGRAQKTVDQLGEYGQQIGDIVKAIDEIAAQTNLLALNAAIEAARAGEQGRGFAVVADNVRQLAERSSQSTKEIAALIAKVRSGTEEAVEAMGLGVRDVEQGREITARAGEALGSIITSVQQSAVQMQSIASDVQGLAEGAQHIVASAEAIATSASESASGADAMARGTTRVTEAIIQVSATSEETSASAEQVSASTQELSAQSEELAATANEMRGLAEQLSGATSRFRLERASS